MQLVKKYHNGAVTTYTNEVVVKGKIIFLHKDEVKEFRRELERIELPSQNLQIISISIKELEPMFITPSTLLVGFVTAVLLFIGVSVVFFQFNEGGILDLLYGEIDPIIFANWIGTAFILSFIGFFLELLIIYRERKIQ